MMSRRPTARFRTQLLVVLGLALVLASLCALMIGPSGFDGLETIDLQNPLFALRISRMMLGLFVGAALASSGSALQALLNNSLADPYIIGVSGGSAVGGALAIVAFGEFFALGVPLASITGALLVSLLLLGFLRHERRGNTQTVLLAGVAINAFAGAIITLFKTLLPAHKTQSLLFWLVGSVGYISLETLMLVAISVAIGILILISSSGSLELLSLGDDEANRLGVDVARTKRRVYFATSLMVGVVVAFCGMIGFVGLVAPQLLRLVIGSDQRILIPTSALLGSLMLVIFDTMGRSAFYYFHTEIPVGALTALFGAPLFAWLLLRQNSVERA